MRLRSPNPQRKLIDTMRVAIACGAAVWLTSSAAHAIDGIRPRTLAQWPDDPACMTIVDRSVSALGHFDYRIAVEDPARGMTITEDEVADGRRHQFLAFPALDPRLAMPEWITWADVMRAAKKGLADPARVADDWVLETHPSLAAMFVRIDADDARRPITFAAADAGVDWDTTSVPAGGWVVRAYTWDPWPNAWSDVRPGVIGIVDGPDPADHPPVLGASIDADILHADQSAELAICIRAEAGTSLAAAWAYAQDPDGVWTDFVEDVAVDDEIVTIPFAPPAEVHGDFVVLRVVATDPSDRVATAYVPGIVTVLATDTPPSCDDTGCDGSSTGAPGTTGPGEPTDASTGESADPEPGSESGSSAPGQDDPRAPVSGCGCLQSAPGPAPWLLVLAPFARRRRAGICAA